MAILRLDHIIATVDDIAAWQAHLTQDLGFPEAWPIGPFWPTALTSGVAIGGLNLELIQPNAGHVGPAEIRTLVFEPIHPASALDRLRRLGIPAREFEKVEPNPELLRLRGFSDEAAHTEQRICTNVLPEGSVPFDFFFCDYTPFLRRRLGRRAFPHPYGDVAGLTVGHPSPDTAAEFMADLGGEHLPLRWQSDISFRIREIVFTNPLGRPLDLPATFRFTQSSVP